MINNVIKALLSILCLVLTQPAISSSNWKDGILKSSQYVVDKNLPTQDALTYWRWTPGTSHLQTPLVIVGDGGPGKFLGRESVESLLEPFTKLKKSRPLYIINLRGTEPNSLLGCMNLELYDCFDKIYGQDLNLELYHYEQYAEDAVKIMDHLGIKNWILYGASYSTRVVSKIAMEHISRTKALVLDSPDSLPDQGSIPEPIKRKLSFSALVSACKSSKSCIEEFPKIQKETESILLALEHNKENIMGLNGAPWDKFEFIKTFYDFTIMPQPNEAAEFINLHSQNPGGYPLTQVSKSLRSIGKDASLFLSRDLSQINPFNYNITNCNEFKKKPSGYLMVHSVWGDDYDRFNTCDGYSTLKYDQLIETNVATYILVNRYDTVTPPNYAKGYKSYFPNHTYLEIDSTGHGVDLKHVASILDTLPF